MFYVNIGVMQAIQAVNEQRMEYERHKRISALPEPIRSKMFAEDKERKKEELKFETEERRHREMCDAIKSTRRGFFI